MSEPLPLRLRGFRGATTVEQDRPEEILGATDDLAPDEQRRFAQIASVESERLSDVAHALATFFDKDVGDARARTPIEEVDDFLLDRGNYFAELESVADELRAACGDASERALADHVRRVQNVSVDGHADISFTAPRTDVPVVTDVMDELVKAVGGAEWTLDQEIGRVSIVGAGMRTSPGVAATMFETLADEGINIEMISTSTIRLSCVVRTADVERAVQALHAAYGLEEARS